MDYDSNYDDKINKFIEIIKDSIQSIAIYKAMVCKLKNHDDDYVYITLLNNCALIVTIKISNLLGTDNEDNHWKNLFSSEQNNIRQNILYTIFSSENEYRDFWNNLIKFRNGFVVHYSFTRLENLEVPCFDKPLLVLYDFLNYIINKFHISGTALNEGEVFYDKCYSSALDFFNK